MFGWFAVVLRLESDVHDVITFASNINCLQDLNLSIIEL